MAIPSYTDEYYDRLSKRLNEEARTPVNRPIFDSLLKRKMAGEDFSHHNINKPLLRYLCINELCGDKALAILFNTSESVIIALRKLYRITPGKIILGNAISRTLKIMDDMEGDTATDHNSLTK